MSFINSFIKSIQTVVTNTGPGAYVINSVDVNYTELRVQGFSSTNFTGFVAADNYIATLTDATHVTVAGAGGLINVVTVIEYYPQFLRQAIQYGTLVIAINNTQKITAHGLTLGTKAFISYLGRTSTRANNGGLALQEGQVCACVYISGANVIAECGNVDYNPSPGQGTVTAGYCLVDPK